jgi:hypothetical protein
MKVLSVVTMGSLPGTFVTVSIPFSTVPE